ncbi:hypothetical protein WMF28_15400 [Sorangium sp. So ce590]|uniref:hypothetical protein n=1 Tax=Sorangium sp. So ce590 TaxID=3133317 RepID=UPI003F621A2A
MLAAILAAIGAVLATPYPWVALVLVGTGYIVYRERLARLGRAGSGGGRPLAVLAVLAALTGVVALILFALVMVLRIPAVWILLGVGGVGYAIYRVARRFRRERLEVLFLDTVAARHASDPRAVELLGALEHRGRHEADAWLLVAADAASRARYQDALAALERAAARVHGIGRLSSGIALAFPGLPAPLSFRPEGGGAGSVEVALAQMHVLAGAPREALGALKLSIADPAYPLGVCALADAHVALGEIDQATMALKQAADAPNCAPELSRSLRYKLARLLEDHESRSAAVREYKALLAQGGQEDAAERLRALRAEIKQEQRREEEARRIEEEARRIEQARRIEEARVEEEARRQRALRAEEQATLEQALAKLEAARGPAGRRSAVRAGLDRLTLQELRDQLLLEASRIEVDAVLEKVDGLKTAAAKRRHLLAALEALRADEIPDDLQAQQIRWIEEALAALEM